MLFPKYGSDLQNQIHGLLEEDHDDGEDLSIRKDPRYLHVLILVQLASNWTSYMLTLEEELLHLVSS